MPCHALFIIPMVQATENLGMAMVYTLVSSAQDWLSEKYGQNAGDGESEENEAEEEEVQLTYSLWQV